MMSMSQIPDLWVVEFSQSQGAFSIRKLSEAVTKNLRMFLDAKACDHSIIALTRTREEASAVCDSLDSRGNRSTPFSPAEAIAVLDELQETGALKFEPTSEPW